MSRGLGDVYKRQGYIVVNEDGDDDGMGYVFDTEHEAQRYANELNKEAMEGNDDFYIE